MNWGTVLWKGLRGTLFGAAAMVILGIGVFISGADFQVLLGGKPYLLFLIPIVKGLLDSAANWLKHRAG